MATRSTPLSLKARAIAWLAQREHSVAELRRKLLRLAELQALNAWMEAHGPCAGAGVSSAVFDGGSATSVDMPSPGGVGSFDLDEDWEEGEWASFMAEWPTGDETPLGLSPAAFADGEHNRTHNQPHNGMHEGEFGGEHGGAAVQRLATGHQERASWHVPAGASDQETAGLARPAEPARRRSGGCTTARHARPVPSAEAWAAIKDEDAQRARAEDVEQLLRWLQERGYLSEARLVESRINARASRYGNRRIQQELRQLGVAPDEEQQSRLKETELARAREVWRRKFGGEVPTEAAARAKQMRFLATRGFSPEVVRRVLRAEDE